MPTNKPNLSHLCFLSNREKGTAAASTVGISSGAEFEIRATQVQASKASARDPPWCGRSRSLFPRPGTGDFLGWGGAWVSCFSHMIKVNLYRRRELRSTRPSPSE